MDAAQSLTDLTEISSQIRAAAIADEAGDLVASTPAGGTALVEAGRALLERAASAKSGAVATQLEAATEEGSVFVLREAARTIVATTGPRPTVGLVFYDLKNALRAIDDAKPKAKRKPRRKKDPDAS